LSQYDGYSQIFTDGFKIGKAVGAAVIVASEVRNKRLSNKASIFSAEARRILLSLDMVRQSPGEKLLLLSDSLLSAKCSKVKFIAPSNC